MTRKTDDAKLMLEAWQTWASAVEIWLLDVAQRKRLTKGTASALSQLFDWDMLEKNVEWKALDQALAEGEQYGKQI